MQYCQTVQRIGHRAFIGGTFLGHTTTNFQSLAVLLLSRIETLGILMQYCQIVQHTSHRAFIGETFLGHTTVDFQSLTVLPLSRIEASNFGMQVCQIVQRPGHIAIESLRILYCEVSIYGQRLII